MKINPDKEAIKVYSEHLTNKVEFAKRWEELRKVYIIRRMKESAYLVQGAQR